MQIVTIGPMTARDLGIVTAALGVILVLTAWQLQGPIPLAPNAPADRFSAARAVSVLAEILREQVPHPVGSPANGIIRRRIESRFQRLGYQTEIQRELVCNGTPACATVENILATRPNDPGPYVLVAAHYDSVAAGPGASDDGVGVASLLEVARAIGEAPGLAFLVTDGEEAGLLGAEAFVKSPWKDRVRIVVNAENRGTSGPAFLFETSRGNAGLMPAIRSIRNPFASSLFYAIYERLPNDTDVTVFKRGGMQAMNFAAIGDVAWYHTPLDDLAHVNTRTVQHHGDNLLSVTRLLLRGVQRTSGNAEFFSIPGWTVIWWPQAWTLWISAATLILIVAGSRGESPRAIATGAALAILTVAGASSFALLLAWFAHLRAGTAEWLAFPQGIVVAMWMSAIAVSLIVLTLPAQRNRRATWTGAGVAWSVAAIGSAWALPGATYLFLVPALAFALCLVFRARPLVAALVTSIAAASVLFLVALFLYPAMGRSSLVPIAIVIALVTTTFVPLLECRTYRLAAGAAVLAVSGALLTLLLPAFTELRPRRAPIEHELQPATVGATTSRSGDVVTIRVSSKRRADRLMIRFDKRVDVLRVNGATPAPLNPLRPRRGEVTFYGAEAVVEVRAPAGTAAIVSDLTYGLPPEAQEAAARRDAANAVTSGWGDVTVSRVKVRI